MKTNQMKYFVEGRNERGYGDPAILLKDSEGDNRTLSVRKEGDHIILMEECDGYFFQTYSKLEFKNMLTELLDWVE